MLVLNFPANATIALEYFARCADQAWDLPAFRHAEFFSSHPHLSSSPHFTPATMQPPVRNQIACNTQSDTRAKVPSTRLAASSLCWFPQLGVKKKRSLALEVAEGSGLIKGTEQQFQKLSGMLGISHVQTALLSGLRKAGRLE